MEILIMSKMGRNFINSCFLLAFVSYFTHSYLLLFPKYSYSKLKFYKYPNLLIVERVSSHFAHSSKLNKQDLSLNSEKQQSKDQYRFQNH